MKKICAILLVTSMLFVFASCGKKSPQNDTKATEANQTQATEDMKSPEDTTDKNNSGSENTDNLNKASTDNYASLLKTYFGIDSKDIEDASFKLTRVSGSYSPKNDVQHMLTIEFETTDLAVSKAYGEKMFGIAKSLSSTGSLYSANLDNGSGMIVKGSNEYTDYNTFHNAEKNNNAWFYSFNGKDILMNVAAGFTVRVQLSYSDK